MRKSRIQYTIKIITTNSSFVSYCVKLRTAIPNNSHTLAGAEASHRHPGEVPEAAGAGGGVAAPDHCQEALQPPVRTPRAAGDPQGDQFLPRLPHLPFLLQSFLSISSQCSLPITFLHSSLLFLL